MHKVIASGSTGNAVLYHNSILIDCGVPFAAVMSHLYNIQIVLLTHEHGDHINLSTLKRMAINRPTLRIGCCEWMRPHVNGLRNVDFYELGKWYNYGSFQIMPIKAYHDVPNCGYRIEKNGHKIIHITDTAHLEGITAKDYDLYAIESNYNEETVFDYIEEKKAKGEFAYQTTAINSHLSEQKARAFIFNNKGPKSSVLRLHESQTI